MQEYEIFPLCPTCGESLVHYPYSEAHGCEYFCELRCLGRIFKSHNTYCPVCNSPVIEVLSSANILGYCSNPCCSGYKAVHITNGLGISWHEIEYLTSPKIEHLITDDVWLMIRDKNTIPLLNTQYQFLIYIFNSVIYSSLGRRKSDE